MEAVQREERGTKGSFFLQHGGERAGELTFTLAGDVMILDHTEVGDALRGQGAGRRMVDAAVDWARSANKKILPLCPFAKAEFEKRPEIRDVLAAR